MDETVRPLCVGSVSPPPSRSHPRCRRILTNEITRRQGVPLFFLSSARLRLSLSLFLLFSPPSIRYSKRPTVTDTTAMIRPGRRCLSTSPPPLAITRNLAVVVSARALFHARSPPREIARVSLRSIDCPDPVLRRKLVPRAKKKEKVVYSNQPPNLFAENKRDDLQSR